jgi:hypothetical protein
VPDKGRQDEIDDVWSTDSSTEDFAIGSPEFFIRSDIVTPIRYWLSISRNRGAIFPDSNVTSFLQGRTGFRQAPVVGFV